MIGITMFFKAATVNTAGIFDLSCNGFVPCNDMPNAIRIIGHRESPIDIDRVVDEARNHEIATFAEIADTAMPSSEPMSSG